VSTVWIGEDLRGTLGVTRGVMHYLTPCCGVTASTRGVVHCPVCLEVVEGEFYEEGWLVTSDAEWRRYSAEVRSVAKRERVKLRPRLITELRASALSCVSDAGGSSGDWAAAVAWAAGPRNWRPRRGSPHDQT